VFFHLWNRQEGQLSTSSLKTYLYIKAETKPSTIYVRRS
jgi:hypothetical protein